MTPSPVAGLKTLHVCHTTARRGAELSTIDLVTALRANGIESEILAVQPGRSGEQLPIRALGRRGRTPLTLWRLRRALRHADVVVAHGASSLLACHLATLGTDVPFVYRMIGDPAFWGDVRFRDLRIGRPLRAAARVATLWQGAADDVHRLYGVPLDRLAVIVNGRDPERFRPPTADERRAARAAFGLPAEGPVVGYLGSLSWEKNPLLANDAVSAVPGATLAIAGDGPLRADVEAAASASGSTVVLGSVTDPQRFLWSVDALLLTSKTEGLPGVVIEAGLCGIPTVATDVGGTGDLVDDTTGLLVNADAQAPAIASALAEVLASAADRGDGARARALERFTIQAAVDDFISTLVDVVGTRRSAES